MLSCDKATPLVRATHVTKEFGAELLVRKAGVQPARPFGHGFQWIITQSTAGRIGTLGPNTRRLIESASEPLCLSPPSLSTASVDLFGPTINDLIETLGQKNGFYAFCAALHVFPSGCLNAPMDLERWNAKTLWVCEYGALTRGYLFFAEDVFGVQFGIRDGAIYKFDPEPGELAPFANSFEEWASRIVDDSEFETGYPLLLEWEKLNGLLPRSKRLLPKQPFILGGEYAATNLYAAGAVAGMKVRAEMWRQLKDHPDGTTVQLKIIND